MWHFKCNVMYLWESTAATWYDVSQVSKDHIFTMHASLSTPQSISKYENIIISTHFNCAVYQCLRADSKAQSMRILQGFTSKLPILLISRWQNVLLPPTDYTTELMSHTPRTPKQPPFPARFWISVSLTLHHPCFMSHEHNLQFQLKWQWSHFMRDLLLHKLQLFIKSVGGQFANYQEAVFQWVTSSVFRWLVQSANWLHLQRSVSDGGFLSVKRSSGCWVRNLPVVSVQQICT